MSVHKGSLVALIVPYLQPPTHLHLTAVFHLLPSTSHRGTPTVRAKWKTANVIEKPKGLTA